MNNNNFTTKLLFIIFLFFSLNSYSFSEIIIFSSCKNEIDGFIKNEYVLNLKKSLMTRNFIYDNKTFKKYRVTDLSIKKI